MSETTHERIVRLLGRFEKAKEEIIDKKDFGFSIILSRKRSYKLPERQIDNSFKGVFGEPMLLNGPCDKKQQALPEHLTAKRSSCKMPSSKIKVAQKNLFLQVFS